MLILFLSLPLSSHQLSCLRLGGNLASIQSVSENKFVRGLIYRRCGSYVSAWIGLFDAIQEGKWLWTDGSNTKLRCWAHGEPNNLHGNENCVEMNFRGTVYWADRPCSWFRPYVCARTVSWYKPVPDIIRKVSQNSGLLGSSRTVPRPIRNVSH
uniref:C-type lectin domain-containing protein n=1 Tax=Sparus aurata TaxID=8175 RepID=A0A671YZV9_SPAAU